jgi:glycosyltransferase involved in cell wall biosynthesis
MRIVQTIPDFGLGGTQKGGCVLGAAMARQGHDVTIIGEAGGPRFNTNPGDRLQHKIVENGRVEDVINLIRFLNPDVVHIHLSHFYPELINGLWALANRPLIVSTPIFGRAPDDLQLLERTKTCLVGIYTFYRFTKWTHQTTDQAIDAGIAYVMITPFEPSTNLLLATDDTAIVESRRDSFGIPPGAFVVGRIGREHFSKWSVDSAELVDMLLKIDPSVHWLSIGYPIEHNRAQLESRWPGRFHNLPETSDYNLIARVLSCMDVQIFFGRGECFASSIAEAAGVGVPTIALATPLKDNGQAEQITDGSTGFLISSVKQAGDCTKQMLGDPRKLATMKENTRSHCIARWHADRVAADLLSLYNLWLAPDSSTANNGKAYQALMKQEVTDFAQTYHQRVATTMSDNPLGRLKWNLLMKMVESPAIWKMGRWLKRLSE